MPCLAVHCSVLFLLFRLFGNLLVVSAARGMEVTRVRCSYMVDKIKGEANSANISGKRAPEEKGLSEAQHIQEMLQVVPAQDPKTDQIASMQPNGWVGVRVQIKAVQEYLKELLESTDQKLLVFAHHKDLLDGIEFIMNK